MAIGRCDRIRGRCSRTCRYAGRHARRGRNRSRGRGSSTSRNRRRTPGGPWRGNPSGSRHAARRRRYSHGYRHGAARRSRRWLHGKALYRRWSEFRFRHRRGPRHASVDPDSRWRRRPGRTAARQAARWQRCRADFGSHGRSRCWRACRRFSLVECPRLRLLLALAHRQPAQQQAHAQQTNHQCTVALANKYWRIGRGGGRPNAPATRRHVRYRSSPELPMVIATDSVATGSIIIAPPVAAAQLIPGRVDPRREHGIIAALLPIRMQPDLQQAVVRLDLFDRRIGFDAENPVGIGIGVEQNLPGIETRRFPKRFGRLPQPCRRRIQFLRRDVGRDRQQLRNPRWQRTLAQPVPLRRCMLQRQGPFQRGAGRTVHPLNPSSVSTFLRGRHVHNRSCSRTRSHTRTPPSGYRTWTATRRPRARAQPSVA